jgi:hypothetical protein
MKKAITSFVLFFGLLTTITLSAQTTKEDPVYLETISNSSKSINFIAGVYPKTLVYSEANENTKLTLRVLNNATDSYKWKDYKVYILLKDNTLFYNYTTKAESGDFACNYTIDGNKGYHDQTVCFSKKFGSDDIKQMWLSFGDDTFISLIYVPGK